MKTRSRLRIGCAASLFPVGVLLSATTAAHAAPQDIEATRVAGTAISEEYVSGKFTVAKRKLEAAIKVCKQGKCSGRVLSRLYRDLGVVFLGGLNKPKAGKEALVRAVETDPSVQLDPDLTTPQIAAAFTEAGGRSRSKKAKPESPQTDEGQPKAEQPKAAQPEKAGKARKSAKLEAEEIKLDEEPDHGEEDGNDPPPTGESIEPGGAPLNWFSIGLQQDFLVHQAANPACFGADYTCFGPGGVEYAGNIDTDKGNQTAGGFGVATTRILLGYDRRFTDQILVGARLGLALGGSPASARGGKFLPLHLELRGSYFFGDEPFHRSGFRPFAGLAAGVAEVDGHIAVDYFDGGKAGDLDAWRKTGKMFASANLGTQFAFGKASAVSVEARLQLMLGTSALAPAIGASYTHGL